MQIRPPASILAPPGPPAPPTGGGGAVMLAPMHLFAWLFVPNEFAPREWRRLLRPRGWLSTVLNIAFALAILVPLFLFLRTWAGKGGHMVLLTLTVLSHSIAPLSISAALFSVWWLRPSFESTFRDFLVTPAGPLPWLLARIHVARCILLTFSTSLVLAAVAYASRNPVEIEFWVIAAAGITEGCLSCWFDLPFFLAITLRSGTLWPSIAWAALVLLPLHFTFFFMTAWSAGIHLGRSVEAFFLWGSAILAVRLILAVWAHRHIPEFAALHAARLADQ